MATPLLTMALMQQAFDLLADPARFSPPHAAAGGRVDVSSMMIYIRNETNRMINGQADLVERRGQNPNLIARRAVVEPPHLQGVRLDR